MEQENKTEVDEGTMRKAQYLLDLLNRIAREGRIKCLSTYTCKVDELFGGGVLKCTASYDVVEGSKPVLFLNVTHTKTTTVSKFVGGKVTTHGSTVDVYTELDADTSPAAPGGKIRILDLNYSDEDISWKLEETEKEGKLEVYNTYGCCPEPLVLRVVYEPMHKIK